MYAKRYVVSDLFYHAVGYANDRDAAEALVQLMNELTGLPHMWEICQ